MNGRENITLTERQRFWLEHLRAWERSGETLKAYAARHELDVRALYTFKKTLTRKGALERERAHFVRARLEPEAALPVVCRVRFPNGCAVEVVCAQSEIGFDDVLRAVAALS